MIPSSHGYPDYPDISPENDDSLNIKRYLSLFLSNWYWFAFSLLIALTIAYGINRYSEKIYTVSSTILISDQNMGGGVSGVENFIPGAALFRSQQNLKNEMGILHSFGLNTRVIDSLPEFRTEYFGVGKRNIVESRLYKRCPFVVITDSIDYQPQYFNVNIRIISPDNYILFAGNKTLPEDTLKFGERFRNYGFDFVIKLRDPANFVFNKDLSNKYYFRFLGTADLANSYRNKLVIYPIDKDATLLTLSVSGSIPEQEADYLNKLMDIYIHQGLEAKNRTADSTLAFINRQLRIVQDSLRVQESKLQDFRTKNGIVDISMRGSDIQTRLLKYEDDKSIIELRKQYFNYLRNYIDSKNETGDIVAPSTIGIESASLENLVGELAIQQKEKLKLAFNLLNDQSPMSLFDENIINIKKAIVENVDNNLKNLDINLANLNSNISSINQELTRLPKTERELLKIQRKYDVNNTVYTYLLEKLAETGIAKSSNDADNKIIDNAYTFNSYQIRPKARSNYIKSLLFGFMVPSIIITLLYYFNNRIIDNSDITRRTNTPIIGYISHNDSGREIPVVENPGSSLAESFRSVRTSLKYMIQDKEKPVISITSTVSSEGKTFVSVNLAAIIAMLGKKVLLIGLDLRRPRIHRILNMSNEEGLSTYLSRNCEVESVIKKTAVENLYYAASGPVPPNPAELINSERMRDFIEYARGEFEFVIIDTPPVAVVADTLLLSDFSDLNLFIIRQRYSSKNTLDLIQELYKGNRLKNMCIAVNDISLTGYYGYGLRYGYYKAYGYTYGKNYYGEYSFSHYGYKDKDYDYYKS